MTASYPLADLFALTSVDMLRLSDGTVIASSFDEYIADRAVTLNLSTGDQQSLRQIAHILIAVTVAQRDSGMPEAFANLAKRLEVERWMNYLQLNLIASGADLTLSLQLAVCQLLEQWEFEEARRLGAVLKVSFCGWLWETLCALPPASSDEA